MAVIETRDLRKRYGRVEALRGVTLKVEPGEVFGLLGQNGAGKTTLIKILLGIVKFGEGEATLFHHPAGTADVRKTRRLPAGRPPVPRVPLGLQPARLLRHPVRHVQGRPPEEDPRAARPGRPGQPDALQDPHLLQGHEAADRASPRPSSTTRS